MYLCHTPLPTVRECMEEEVEEEEEEEEDEDDVKAYGEAAKKKKTSRRKAIDQANKLAKDAVAADRSPRTTDADGRQSVEAGVVMHTLSDGVCMVRRCRLTSG